MQKTDLAGVPGSTAAATTPERVQALGAALALLVLVLLVVLDLWIPPDYAVLTALFALAPLIACAVVPVRGTALIAGLAASAAGLSGLWNGAWGTPQQTVRILDVILVGAAAVAIAAVRVYRERRFAQLAEIAQVAQRAILPVLPARAANVAIAARYQSAAQGALVGGDLFDCYHSQERTRLLVGDVRGKGITGVEQAARVIRAFRQSAALRESLTEVAAEMDDYLASFFSDEEFVTALLVEVTDPGVLRLVSAGHPGPQLVRSTEAGILELPPGLPLGLGLGGSANAYVETRVSWSTGDRLLMYTDGLSEARDSQGVFLPVSSLSDPVRSGSVEQAVDNVVAAARAHVPRGRLDDDLAVIVIEHLPGTSSMQGAAGIYQAAARTTSDEPASRPAAEPVIGPTSDPPHTAGTEITTDAQALPAPPRHPRAPDRPSGTAGPHARTSR